MVLVLFVVYFFLQSFRTTIIPAIAVPVSLFDKYNPKQFEIIGKIEPVCRGKRIYKRLLIKKKS